MGSGTAKSHIYYKTECLCSFTVNQVIIVYRSRVGGDWTFLEFFFYFCFLSSTRLLSDARMDLGAQSVEPQQGTPFGVLKWCLFGHFHTLNVDASREMSSFNTLKR